MGEGPPGLRFTPQGEWYGSNPPAYGEVHCAATGQSCIRKPMYEIGTNFLGNAPGEWLNLLLRPHICETLTCFHPAGIKCTGTDKLPVKDFK